MISDTNRTPRTFTYDYFFILSQPTKKYKGNADNAAGCRKTGGR